METAAMKKYIFIAALLPGSSVTAVTYYIDSQEGKMQTAEHP